MEENQQQEFQLSKFKRGSWIKAWKNEWLLYVGFKPEELVGDKNITTTKLSLVLATKRDANGFPYLEVRKKP